jgi:hypothetical protein
MSNINARLAVAVLTFTFVVSLGRGAAPTTEAAGSFSRSLLFAGVDGQYGHVEVANAPALSLGNTFTLEAWIRPGLSTSFPTILSKDFRRTASTT